MLITDRGVTAKIYPVEQGRESKKPGQKTRTVYAISYGTPDGRKTAQRGKLVNAIEFARLMVGSTAAGKAETVDMNERDRMELIEARKKTGDTPLLIALEEWAKSRELVGGDVITACEAWRRRLTKFTRISVFECVKRYKASFIKLRRQDAPKGLSEEELERAIIPNSYRSVLKHFTEDFGTRYMDDLNKTELDEWFAKKDNGTTANTYRKRVVTLFRWARRSEFLSRDMTTEADQTERAREEAPKRELTAPETLARILFLLQFGIDLDDLDKKCDPRPDLVPPVVLSAFSGYRSCEGDVQNWDDLDMDENIGNVTKAKKGTAWDRPTDLSSPNTQQLPRLILRVRLCFGWHAGAEDCFINESKWYFQLFPSLPDVEEVSD